MPLATFVEPTPTAAPPETLELTSDGSEYQIASVPSHLRRFEGRLYGDQATFDAEFSGIVEAYERRELKEIVAGLGVIATAESDDAGEEARRLLQKWTDTRD